MRSLTVLASALMLWCLPLASRADSSTARPTYTASPEDRACSYKAISPYHLEALKPPQSCGVGRWLPEALYLHLFDDAIRGQRCEDDIASSVRIAVAEYDLKLEAERQQRKLYQSEAYRLQREAHPSFLWRVFRVSMGTLAGGGVGLAGGGVLVATDRASAEDGLVAGLAIGAGVGLISGIVVELLR